MKFFTPELYLQFNSPDDQIAETAHEAWESALARYERHLNRISSRLTPATRKIAKTLCLHDGQYSGISLPLLPTGDNSLAVLSTRSDSKLIVLLYVLAEEPLIQEVGEPWPYAKDNPCWLYDEFDIDSHGIQQHEILISSGRVITLRFHEMQQMEYVVPAPSAVA
jgi:hypothetical protein